MGGGGKVNKTLTVFWTQTVKDTAIDLLKVMMFGVAHVALSSDSE